MRHMLFGFGSRCKFGNRLTGIGSRLCNGNGSLDSKYEGSGVGSGIALRVRSGIALRVRSDVAAVVVSQTLGAGVGSGIGSGSNKYIAKRIRRGSSRGSREDRSTASNTKRSRIAGAFEGADSLKESRDIKSIKRVSPRVSNEDRQEDQMSIVERVK